MLTPHSCARQAKEITTGLAFLHGQQPPVVHADLRGVSSHSIRDCLTMLTRRKILTKGNILVADDGRCCIADFGISRLVENTFGMGYTATPSSKNPRCTVRWCAPEVLDPNSSPKTREPSRDVYSLGCTFIEVTFSHSTLVEYKTLNQSPDIRWRPCTIPWAE